MASRRVVGRILGERGKPPPKGPKSTSIKRPDLSKKKDWKKIRDKELKYPGVYTWGEGCDFEHWRVYTKPLPGFLAKPQIIRYYIDTLTPLFGCEEEAMKRIYSVATRHYYAFGANVSIDLVDKLHDLPNVFCVTPDAFRDDRIFRSYPWDRFIDGKAFRYDPQNYHPTAPRECLTDEDKGIACPPGEHPLSEGN